MWNRGRRLFSTAGILMLLTAMAHALGNLSYQPSNAAEENLMADMAEFHAPLGLGMSPSVKDIYFCLGWAVSLLMATLGVMNLLLAAIPETPVSVLRRVSIWNAIWVGCLGRCAGVIRFHRR
jgi:hypothetical protein